MVLLTCCQSCARHVKHVTSAARSAVLPSPPFAGPCARARLSARRGSCHRCGLERSRRARWGTGDRVYGAPPFDGFADAGRDSLHRRRRFHTVVLASDAFVARGT
jgi:hypothetical protein